MTWPKLWHNLRASRETELMREYDLATVCKWIGNSPAVAAKHYAMSVDLNADFAKAVGPVSEAQQSTVRKGCQAVTSEKPTNEKTLENQGFVFPGQRVSNTVITGYGPETIRTSDLVLIRDAL